MGTVPDAHTSTLKRSWTHLTQKRSGLIMA
jgi:hypothetical protein